METPISKLNYRDADGRDYGNVRSARAAFMRAVQDVHGINLSRCIKFQHCGFTGGVGISDLGELWAHASSENGLVQEVRVFTDIRTARKWLIQQACRLIDMERLTMAGHVHKLATDALEPLRVTPGVSNPLRRRRPRWQHVEQQAGA